MKGHITMWRYAAYMGVAILFLCGLTFALSSCDNDRDNPGEEPSPGGREVAVEFNVGLGSFGAEETVVRGPVRVEPETVVIPVGGDILMDASLEPAPAPKTRAIETTLEDGVKVRILAYEGASTTTSLYADYEASGGILVPTASPLRVIEGSTYTFVAYAINDPLQPLPEYNDPNTEVTTLGTINAVNDLLWGSVANQTIATPPASPTKVSLLMGHKFPRVLVDVAMATGDPEVGTGYNIGDVEDIFIIRGKKDDDTADPGKLVSLNVRAGTLNDTTTDITQPTTDGYRVVYMTGAGQLALSIGAVTIDGDRYAGPFIALFGRQTPLVGGGTYVLRVSFHRNRWAGSNIYWDGSKLTFATVNDPQRHEKEHYQGVFFKWGSLVGIQPVLTTNNPGANYAQNSTVVYRPVVRGVSGAVVPDEGKFSAGTITSVWDSYSIPYVDFPYNPAAAIGYLNDVNRNEGFWFRYNEYTADRLRGDICQYLGAYDTELAGYRMPTAEDFGVEHHFTNTDPDWGAARDDGWYKTGGTDWSSNNQTSINGLVTGGMHRITQRGADYRGAFFPASGFRDMVAGELMYVNTRGVYWTASQAQTTGGNILQAYSMDFANRELNSRNSSGRANAHPVRCIRRMPNDPYVMLPAQ